MSSKHKKKQHLRLALENDVACDKSEAVKVTANQDSNVERRSGQDRRQGGDRTKETNQLGTARGIETMFRNAYRAQLDLLALAATKANIIRNGKADDGSLHALSLLGPHLSRG